MKTLKLLSLSVLLAFVTSCASVTKDTQMKQISSIEDLAKLPKTSHNISMYPEAKEGEERLIIYLPELQNEKDYEIELVVGKWAEVDCNHHSLMGVIKDNNVDGWGYNYYTFETNGAMASTRMACPDQELQNKLVQAKSTKTRYNSKLPIVMIVPKGYTLSYNLWGKIGTTTL